VSRKSHNSIIQDVTNVKKCICRSQEETGLKFGIYLSPWDQNHPTYGTSEYNTVFVNTLKEVLANYGEIFEQWFDGACGEGVDGKLQIYDWELFNKTVYEMQPNAIIFSDVGPGCRWVGNEIGVAGETNWSTLNVAGYTPGHGAPTPKILNEGNMNGEKWIPAEVDVSIRPGWFYSPSTDDKVKSVDELTDIYYASIGRNSNSLLNVPPDRRGLIHQNDSTRLMEFAKVIKESFSNNIAKNAEIKTSNVRGNSSVYSGKNLFEDNYDSYWTTDDNITNAIIEISFNEKKSFNCLVLQEYIPLGQRISKFSVEYFDENRWILIDEQTTIGYKRILRFPQITTNKLKINIKEALACPILNKIEIYNTEN